MSFVQDDAGILPAQEGLGDHTFCRNEAPREKTDPARARGGDGQTMPLSVTQRLSTQRAEGTASIRSSSIAEGVLGRKHERRVIARKG